MEKVPFIANSPDDMHCVNAVFRMVHKYYFGKDYTWKEIDRLTKTIPGKATWTFIGEMEFAKKGLNVLNIEPVDYEILYKEGIGYLKKIVGEQTAKYYLENSNIASVIKYIPDYLKWVTHETKRATVNEVITYLKQGALIGAEINSSILNDKPGFNLHFVLLYDFGGKELILHDPGLPPIKARKLRLTEFKKCFSFEGANGGIVVFNT